MNGPSLRDIHLPAAGWWPFAPGWWVLAGVVALFCVIAMVWRVWRVRRSPQRAALREVDALEAAYLRDKDVAQLVDGASRLMHRIARRVEPGIASQSGDAWRSFVRRYARDDGTRNVLDRLARVRFRARPAMDVAALITALRAWCRDALRGRVSSTPFGKRGAAAKRREDETRVQYKPEKSAS